MSRVPTTKLFVYGSLMKGGSLHGYLKNHKFLGTAGIHGDLITNPYISNLPCPTVILHKFGVLVYGEVYEIPEGYLHTMDKVEGAPRLYKRVQTEITTGDTVWVYVFPGEVIPSGDWRKHLDSKRD